MQIPWTHEQRSNPKISQVRRLWPPAINRLVLVLFLVICQRMIHFPLSPTSPTMPLDYRGLVRLLLSDSYSCCLRLNTQMYAEGFVSLYTTWKITAANQSKLNLSQSVTSNAAGCYGYPLKHLVYPRLRPEVKHWSGANKNKWLLGNKSSCDVSSDQ